MDSSATVKVRLRKGAAALRSYTPAPRTVFRKRILCCGWKINNGCSPSFERRMGSIVPSSLLLLHLFLPHTAAAGFPRSADASLAFSVCSTNKSSSKKSHPSPEWSRCPIQSFLFLFLSSLDPRFSRRRWKHPLTGFSRRKRPSESFRKREGVFHGVVTARSLILVP